MSVNPFNVSLQLIVKSSLQKWMIVIIPHFVVFVLIVSLDVFSPRLKIILVFLIVISFVYYSCLHLFLIHKKSVTSIKQDSRKNWFITTFDSNNKCELKSVNLLPSSFVSEVIVVLNYQDIDLYYYTVIITADSLSTSEYRRLRVRLKLTNINNN